METIGFVGIGQMGKLMVSHLLQENYTVYANDVNPSEVEYICNKGALAAPEIRDIAQKSEIAILMLPNSTIVESVVLGDDGLIENMRKGQIIVDMSSSDMNSTMKLAKAAREKGIIYVDAPVSGGKKKAAEGNLTIMVGGEQQSFERIYPVLKCMGEKIIHVGDVGHGHANKAINNYLSAASLYASSEAMVMAEAVGLDLNKALEVFNGSSGQSYSTTYKMPNFILNRNFNTGFSLDLLLKDIKMANDLARQHDVPVLLGSVVEQIYLSATKLLNDRERDHTEITKYLEEISGEKLEYVNEKI